MIKIHYIKSVFTLLTALLFLPFGLRAEVEEINITIPFELVNGLIIMQAEVDGVTGSYILDTGANAILIDGQPETSDQLLATPEGDVKMAHRQLTQLTIGDFTQYRISAQVISLTSLKEQLGIELNGIIGGGYFMPNILNIDFSDLSITISSTSPSETLVADLHALEFQMINDIPIVDVEIEGETYHFAMDSGASIHFMDATVLEELASAKKLKTTSQVLTVNQINISHEQYILNRFKLGAVNFSGHHFISQHFESINIELDVAISGILSLSQLTRDKVILDFKNKIIYL